MINFIFMKFWKVILGYGDSGMISLILTVHITHLECVWMLVWRFWPRNQEMASFVLVMKMVRFWDSILFWAWNWVFMMTWTLSKHHLRCVWSVVRAWLELFWNLDVGLLSVQESCFWSLSNFVNWLVNQMGRGLAGFWWVNWCVMHQKTWSFIGIYGGLNSMEVWYILMYFSKKQWWWICGTMAKWS